MSEFFNLDRRKNRDRRETARVMTGGRIRIWFDDPAPSMVEAEMIESSASGFRAAHDSKALEPGLNVRYQGPSASGRARIIWTHVLQGRRVSGFLRLGAADHEPIRR